MHQFRTPVLESRSHPSPAVALSPLFRGTVLFLLYVLLVITPAAVAIRLDPFAVQRPWLTEFSVALALLAAPIILVQFALVSRLSASARLFGNDALLHFHRFMGLLALAFVLLHPLLLNITGLPWSAWSPFTGTRAAMSGAISLWALVLLALTTLFRARARLSYERWRALHVTLSVVTVVAFFVHVLEVGNYTGAPALRATLGGYVLAFGALLVAYRVVRPLRLRRRPWEIVELVDEGADTHTLRLRPVGHDGFRFDPGQFAWLMTGRSPFSRQQHPITIASSAERPLGGTIDLAVKELGDWSREVVPRLQPGTRVWVDGAFGAFTTERKAGQGFVMIAGGIGITPMRSMLLTMRDRGDLRHVQLIYAARDRSRMPFLAELETLRESLNLDIVEILEAPPPDWPGERGILSAELLERTLPPQVRRYHCFICGPAPMMNLAEELLMQAGVPGSAIDSERFDIV